MILDIGIVPTSCFCFINHVLSIHFASLKIVRIYYGGREISHEDLEKALLVGMSPHERRKFQKKNGVSCKCSSASSLDNKPESSGVKFVDDAAATCGSPIYKASSEHSDVKDIIGLDNGNFSESRISPKATANGKCNSKVSLLGHGPHGKEVVEYLLKTYGEDGIHQFCQSWRQVFVDTLHPRHLPAGWDIKHR